MSDKFSMPASMGRMKTEAIAGYLQSRGWKQVDCRYADRISMEGDMHGGGQPYQIYLPASPDVPKYRTLLQRVIYKLSGIEDREPPEIVRDILAHASARLIPETARQQRQCIRVKNSSSGRMRVRLASREQEYQLFPDESIVLVCHTSAEGALEIEHSDSLLLIRDDR